MGELRKGSLFGRQEDLDNIKSLLRKNHFVALIGPSYSGKPGMIRESLSDSLEEGGFQGKAGSRWSVASVILKGNPVEALAAALAEPGVLSNRKTRPEFEEILAQDLLDRKTDLAGIYKSSEFARDHNLVIFIDEFERVFSKSDTQAPLLAELLIRGCSDPGAAIYVLLSFSEEGLSKIPRHPKFEMLWAAIQNSQYHLHALSQGALERALKESIQDANVKFEDKQTQELIDELYFEREQLPKLKNYISKIKIGWTGEGKSTEKSKRVSLKEKEEKQEPVRAAGEKTILVTPPAFSDDRSWEPAEEIYNQLATRYQQSVCGKLFQVLAEQNKETGELECSSLPVKKICTYGDIPLTEVQKVLQPFLEAGLLFANKSEIREETLIFQQSPNALSRWPRLKDWYQEEQKNAGIFLEMLNGSTRYEENAEWEAVGSRSDITKWVAWFDQEQPAENWASRYTGNPGQAFAFLDQCRDYLNTPAEKQPAKVVLPPKEEAPAEPEVKSYQEEAPAVPEVKPQQEEAPAEPEKSPRMKIQIKKK